MANDSVPPQQSPWYRTAYRRAVLDMHISDYDEAFLTQFDPEDYARQLEHAGAQSAVLYAHSHVGFTTYPTAVGGMHPNLEGRDIFAEMVRCCRARNIAPVCYYSLIIDAWAYDSNPDWRILDRDGNPAAAGHRYGSCCPNSPYADHAAEQARELCLGYDFAGFRFDMTFWPAVCHCRHCRERFDSEIGGPLPTSVNWSDPRWVRFQKRRESWLVQFARRMTSIVKTLRPEVSVEHQSSGLLMPWPGGVTVDLADCNDFLQGDFYRGALEASFVQKMLGELSPHAPFGYETSSARSLRDHTTPKSDVEIRTRAGSAMANGGAFIFIDAVDPIGTVNPAVYDRLKPVFAEIESFQTHLGGERCADVAVYFSTESKFDPQSGAAGFQWDEHQNTPHLEDALGVTRALVRAHIPFTVITRQNLGDLARFQVLVLPNVLIMSAGECEAIRDFVSRGGALYASKYTSLSKTTWRDQDDFMLADLFGVSYKGETKESLTYIAPAGKGCDLLPGGSEKYPFCIEGSQLIVSQGTDSTVLGTTILPYTSPEEPRPYASIHSNPPGKATGDPAIVLHSYGRGKCLYCVTDIERHPHHDETFIRLVRSLRTRPWQFDSDAPGAVEITMFQQVDRSRFILSFLNCQDPAPPVPARLVNVRVHLGEERQACRVSELPRATGIPFSAEDGWVEFLLPGVSLFAMVEVSYTPS